MVIIVKCIMSLHKARLDMVTLKTSFTATFYNSEAKLVSNFSWNKDQAKRTFSATFPLLQVALQIIAWDKSVKLTIWKCHFVGDTDKSRSISMNHCFQQCLLLLFFWGWEHFFLPINTGLLLKTRLSHQVDICLIQFTGRFGSEAGVVGH